ncbi:hypothetical protein KSF73_09765 [Burkholderiaceae bacterium DAT-1]|nr:hypothetical protein [Burkholderiaceae bacterium DAT-1]
MTSMHRPGARFRVQINPTGKAAVSRPMVRTVSGSSRIVAMIGMMLYWGVWSGWMDWGKTGLDAAMFVCLLCQIPLLLQWLRRSRVR